MVSWCYVYKCPVDHVLMVSWCYVYKCQVDHVLMVSWCYVYTCQVDHVLMVGWCYLQKNHRHSVGGLMLMQSSSPGQPDVKFSVSTQNCIC